MSTSTHKQPCPSHRSRVVGGHCSLCCTSFRAGPCPAHPLPPPPPPHQQPQQQVTASNPASCAAATLHTETECQGLPPFNLCHSCLHHSIKIWHKSVLFFLFLFFSSVIAQMEESTHLVPVNDHCPKFDYSVTLEGCVGVPDWLWCL